MSDVFIGNFEHGSHLLLVFNCRMGKYLILPSNSYWEKAQENKQGAINAQLALLK